jgi:hypothetical protein
MGTMTGNGSDVVSFLKEQHHQIAEMLEKVLSTHGPERAKAYVALRRTLAVHETAEAEIIHPAARRALEDGQRVVEARLHEEREIKMALAQLEKLDVDSADFQTKFGALRAKVIAHNELEEREEFDRLGSKLDPARLERMRKAALFAQAVAPTRPHPHIDSLAASLFAGPIAAVVDRARDALARRER